SFSTQLASWLASWRGRGDFGLAAGGVSGTAFGSTVVSGPGSATAAASFAEEAAGGAWASAGGMTPRKTNVAAMRARALIDGPSALVEQTGCVAVRCTAGRCARCSGRAPAYEKCARARP